jgi:hypothetical protein
MDHCQADSFADIGLAGGDGQYFGIAAEVSAPRDWQCPFQRAAKALGIKRRSILEIAALKVQC